MGLELVGEVKEPEVRQTVCLAARSLEQMGQPWVLEISHMGYLFGLFDALGVPENARPGLLEKLREKNAHELRRARQAASNYRYAKSWLALALPVAYCLLDAAGTFADSRVLTRLDPDAANCAYELTFLFAAVVSFVYVKFIRHDRFLPKREGLSLIHI